MSAFRRIALLLIAAVVLACSGCGKDTPPGSSPDVFTQGNADDIMQMVGVMMATDFGGWLSVLQSTVVSTNGLQTFGGPAAPPNSILRDTTFMIGPMNYAINYTYVDTLIQDHSRWVPGTFLVEGVVRGTGSFMTSGFDGSYSHNSEFDGDYRNFPGMIEFAGFNEDTLLGLMRSTFRAESLYYLVDNFYDYGNVLMSRDYMTNPWPISGSVVMQIDAIRLNSLSVTDVHSTNQGLLTITFNGTEEVDTIITEDFKPPTGTYLHRLNLRTGAVTRR